MVGRNILSRQELDEIAFSSPSVINDYNRANDDAFQDQVNPREKCNNAVKQQRNNNEYSRSSIKRKIKITIITEIVFLTI